MMLVGGLVAFGTYKMSTRDADRIKDETGVAPEEMTDEELEASMDRLGIEKQYRDSSDVEDPASAGGDGVNTAIADIERLAELHEKGVLTDEEFSAKKRQMLGL
jgi:hypothetical protein